MFGRKSSHEAEVGSHGISYCIEIVAFVARIGLVEAIGASGCVVSLGVEGTIIGVTRGRISFWKGGIVGSPYAFQRAIQMSWGSIAFPMKLRQ